MDKQTQIKEDSNAKTQQLPMGQLFYLLYSNGFRVKPDDPGDEFGRSIYNIVMDQVATYDYPVCFNFPVGHQKINYALKCGVEYQLEVGEYQVSFREAKA